MRLSHYLKAWPAPETNDQVLLFSTRRGSLALIPAQVYLRLQQGLEIDPEHAAPLTDLDMLVADPTREKKEVRAMLSEINRLDSSLAVAIIPGLKCNFACGYCYEGTMKGDISMSDTVADQLVAFLKTRFTQAGRKKLSLAFYGGEPLLYTDRIKQLALELKPFVETAGGDFEFSLVTNGSLLTRRRVEELLPLGLTGAKVTVDGPPETHNRSRPFKNGGKSFTVIINNLKECADLLKIGLGGNFTADNYRQFPKLLDYLAGNGLGPDRVYQVQFTPAMQVSDAFALPEFKSGCGSANEPWVAEAEILMRGEILQRGYKTSEITPAPCMVDMENSLVVNHDGTIAKCVALIGRPQYSIGTVATGLEQDYSARYHLNHWQRNRECQECEYLPLCLGGCRYMKLQRDGDMAEVDCQRQFFDATLEEIIKLDARYLYGAG